MRLSGGELPEASDAGCFAGCGSHISHLAVPVSDNRLVGIIDLRHHIDHPIPGMWGGHMGYAGAVEGEADENKAIHRK